MHTFGAPQAQVFGILQMASLTERLLSTPKAAIITTDGAGASRSIASAMRSFGRLGRIMIVTGRHTFNAWADILETFAGIAKGSGRVHYVTPQLVINDLPNLAGFDAIYVDRVLIGPRFLEALVALPDTNKRVWVRPKPGQEKLITQFTPISVGG